MPIALLDERDKAELQEQIDQKIDKESIVHTAGDSEATVMSQKGVTDVVEVLRKNTASFVTENALTDHTIALENPHTYISISENYIPKSTTDYLGISNYRICNSGDTLTYKLSNQVDKPILATYDKGFNIVNAILGQGQSKYLEGEYTFTENEAYFRICSCTAESYLSRYSIKYNSQKETLLATKEDLLSINESLLDTNSSIGVVRDVASVISKYTVSAEAINENPYTYIDENANGVIKTTASAMGCSNYRLCKQGDTLKYKLSADNNNPIIATYDKNLNLVSTIMATGRADIIEGEYTFAENEAYFRIQGATGYLSKYYAEYVSSYEIGSTQENESTLPDYYTEYMAERITAINNKDCLVGSHGDSFVFITDTHTPRNKMNSPALIREIVNKSSVRFVINGGDTIDNDDTWDDAISHLREWRDLMCGVTEYRIMGNHDLNTSGNDVVEARLSTDDWYGTMIKPLEDIVKTDGKYHYCIDNESQKIRYICLSYLNGAEAERTWFKQCLTELEAGWTVLVIPHYLFGSEAGVIHANGQYVIDDINEVYATMNATLIGVLAGHTHADYSITESVNGYHLIATTCDTFTGTPTKTVGTYTEQAFDVIHIDTKNKKVYATRIGAGNDREWSY